MQNPAKQNAEFHWQRARRKVLYDEVVCLIRRCSVNMLSFEDVRANLHLRQKIDRGLQSIPLAQIRGSVGRFNDFTNAFLPRGDHLHDRWINVDIGLKEGKTPPIDVYQVGDAYFVVDGNHRVSAARLQGWTFIDAYVTEFVTPIKISAEADLEEILAKSEQAAFLDQIGPIQPEIAQSFVFTCTGCYEDIARQVEEQRLNMEAVEGRLVTSAQAFQQWYDEIYFPAVDAIRHHALLDQFPNRTEGDLFFWTQQQSDNLEALVTSEEVQ